jgi:ESX secretion-associated protein EspA/E
MGLLGKLESFGKAVWETGKDAVGIVGDVGAIVDGAAAMGEFIERVGKLANLDDVIEAGGRLAGWAKRVGLNKFLRAADSPILDGGQLVIAGMKLTTGVGAPEDGERFGQAGVRCRDAVGTLKSAQPAASWSGEGAAAYSARNVEQMAGIRSMAAVDHDVHRVLANEAFQVGMHRDRLDDWYNWLADVGLVTFALGLIPGVGKGLKAAADAHAVLVAVGSSSIELYQLSSEVDANAANLQQLVGRYGDVASAAHISKTRPDQNPPPPAPPSEPTDQAPKDAPADERPEEAPTPPSDEKPGPSGHLAAPQSRPSGAGGGPPASGGAAAAPATAMPETPAQEPETPGSAAAPAATGALPAASAGAPPPPMSAGAAPMPAAPGIPVGLIKEAIQAALQKEAEKRDENGKPDEDDDVKDEDGDGVPDEDARPDGEADEAASGASRTGGDRPPMHVEMDVDVARLAAPATVTFTGENPIGPSPTSTP